MNKLYCALAILSFIWIACSCGSSIDRLPIPDEIKTDVIIRSSCTLAASNGCFEDKDVEAAIGPLETSNACVDKVKSIIDNHNGGDLETVYRFTSLVFTCKRFSSVLKKLRGE